MKAAPAIGGSSNSCSSLDALRVNSDWAKLPLFGCSKWRRLRFGDVVENVNETCDPAEAIENREPQFSRNLEMADLPRILPTFYQ